MTNLIKFWPQIVILTLIILPEIKTYFMSGLDIKVKMSKINSILIKFFEIAALKYGGFFNEYHWPQYIYIVFSFLYI